MLMISKRLLAINLFNNPLLIKRVYKKCYTYINILFAFMVLLVMSFISCAKSDVKILKKTLPEVERDTFQTLIHEIIQKDFVIKAEAFITYDILDVEEDSFYERYYLLSMIDDINEKLEIQNSYTFPFVFVFDKEKDKMIRSYYPGDEVSYIDFRNNFSSTSISKLREPDMEKHIQQIEKLRSTNLWNAETYYGNSKD